MFLEVSGLKVQFSTEDGVMQAVTGLSFSVNRGETLAIVGESGSGKTATILAIMGLHGRSAKIDGDIRLEGKSLAGASDIEMRHLRGNRMAMIFQDPLTAMHPYHRVGDQIVEAYRAHRSVSLDKARKRALEMLDRVGMAEPKRCFGAYPHQLSGGMRQRAMIAMALVCDPALLIADEPTTALDVTIQAQILDLLSDIQKEFKSAIILITHDLGVVAELADDVVVMYGGRGVETGTVYDVFHRPQHPYTRGLLHSVPRLDLHRTRLNAIPGSPPLLSNMPKGCHFSPRCPHTGEVPGELCLQMVPALNETEVGHRVACHLPGISGAKERASQHSGRIAQ